ncbi:MAG: cell cycle transcriptional regulator TrcR [Alphaproteobacteria bacterium]
MAARAEDLNGTLLMPKATTMWLIENSVLTFKQIADFTGVNVVEVEALADGDVGRGIVGRDPIKHSEITQEELNRCEADPEAKLVISKTALPSVKSRSKGPRYTPVSKRGDKPDAIAYILKHNTEISDAQICKLVGTTKPTIEKVRDRSHPNTPNLKPRHPADLGLCTYVEYEKAVDKGLKAQGKDPEEVRAERLAQQQAEYQATQDDEDTNAQSGGGGFDFSNFLSTDNNDSAG